MYVGRYSKFGSPDTVSSVRLASTIGAAQENDLFFPAISGGGQEVGQGAAETVQNYGLRMPLTQYVAAVRQSFYIR